MRQKYSDCKFTAKSLLLINKINGIIADYPGYNLTLRQIYYQLVATGDIENTMRNYKKIGNVVNKARLAGLIDWDKIADRTRNCAGRDNFFTTPKNVIINAAEQFRLGRWFNQPNYLEVWVEKDAQIDTVARACFDTDTVQFSCRGYCSQTAMREAAQRFIYECEYGRDCHLLYCGDFDPSGLDMRRDIADRLKFFGAIVDIRFIALTDTQIQEFKPPTNPAKITDSRAKKFIADYGEYSWELDALPPRYIEHLIKAEIDTFIDRNILTKTLQLEAAMRSDFQFIAGNYDEIVDNFKAG